MAEYTGKGAETAAAIMRRADEVLHVDHDLDEAVARMKDAKTPFLPVVDGDEIVGSLSAARMPAGVDAAGERRRAAVRDVMSATVTFCYTDDPLSKVRAVMDAAGIDHIFALDRDGSLKGVVVLDDMRTGKAGARQAEGDARHAPDAAAEGRQEKTGGRAKWGTPGGRPATYAERPTLKRKRGATSED